MHAKVNTAAKAVARGNMIDVALRLGLRECKPIFESL